jgi:hypothetical protein
MDPASDQTQRFNKRVRIDTESTVRPAKSLDPIEALKHTSSNLIMTLPLTMQPLAEKHSDIFLNLRKDLMKLYDTKKRLANEDFTPRSTRVKFQLGATDRVKENAAAEFDSLVSRCNMIVDDFHTGVKSQISATVDLEIKVLQELIRKEFCLGVHALIGFRAVALSLTSSQSHTLALHTVLSNMDTLSKYTETPSEEIFLSTYKSATNDITPLLEFITLTEEAIADIQEHVSPFLRTIDDIYVKPWDSYANAKKNQIRTNELKQYVDTHLKEYSTAQTAMDLEDGSLTQTVVKELVGDAVDKALKPYKKMVADLTKKLHANNKKASPKSPDTNSSNKAKNNNRGAKNASAPSTKKKGPKPTRDNVQKADESDNASTAGKKEKKKKGKSANKKKPRKPKHD